MKRKPARRRKFSSNRKSKRPNPSLAMRQLEKLELRNLLASDFTYDQSLAFQALDARFLAGPVDVRLVRSSDNTTLHSVALADFTGVVNIKGSAFADTIRFDPSLGNLGSLLKSVSFDGGLASDSATVEGKLQTNGQAVTLVSESITVLAGASVSTRLQDASSVTTGDSGNITLTGKTVTLQSGASLLAGVSIGSTFKAGDITITVDDKPTAAESIFGDLVLPLLIANRVASVTAVGAEIEGADISINAGADTQTRWDDVGKYFDGIANQLLASASSLVDVIGSLVSPLTGQVKIQKATGDISLTDTKIKSTGEVELAATSDSNASFVTVGINSLFAASLPFIVNVGYGETLAKANVSLEGTTEITASGDVSVTSTATAEAEVVSRASANDRLAKSDAVDVGISLGIAVQNQESRVTLGEKAKIESTGGSVEFSAKGDGTTHGEGEALVFRDGIAGIAVGVAVEKATITSEVNGTILAGNPQKDSIFEFTPSSVVDISENSITLANIDEDNALERGKTLIYRSLGNAVVGGLEDGQSYFVADVENVPSGATFTGTQKIWLSKSKSLELDVKQVQPNAMHTLAALALTEFPSTAVGQDANGNLAIDLPGFNTGDKVTYLGPNSPVTEKGIQARFQRNAGGDRIIRTDGGTDWKALALHVNQTIEVADAKGNKTALTIKAFGPDGKTLILQQVNVVTEGVFSGITVSTTPTTPLGITNLIQNTEYEVVRQSGKVLLKDPADPTKLIKFDKSGSGIHGFSYTKNKHSFAPKTAVDNDRDTIEISNHGYQTGDLLVYRTDPTRSITRPVSGFTSSDQATPLSLGNVQLPDAPIDGMETGFYYYVTRVDANHIRLSEGSVSAQRSEIIDLTSAPGGKHQFAFPSDATGIKITAELEASNSVAAGVALSDSEQPWPSVFASSLTGQSQALVAGGAGAINLVTLLRNKIANKAQTATPQHNPNAPCRPSTPAPGADTGVSFELAGTFAINVYQHDVKAHVGPKAVLKSGKDIQVSAEIKQSATVASISEATRDGSDAADVSDTGESREDIEISVALGLGINKNNASAIIDAGATVDASGAITVESTVSYPLLADFTPESTINPAKAFKENGLDGFAFLLDGTLGIGSNLFNTWVSSIAGDPGSAAADKFVLGLGVGVQIFDNKSIARIGEGAKINQDIALRTATQSVNVSANTKLEMVEVGHIAAVNLSITGLYDAGSALFKRDPVGALEGLVNPFGVSGQNAIGASVLVISANNETTAEISKSAKIHTGISGDGLSVTANQDVFNVAVAITGGKASEFGASPSVTVGLFNTKTKALITSGAEITGGPVDVDAEDTLSRYGIDGGYMMGQKVGVGVAIGVNIIDRTTLAYIGSDSPDTDAFPTGAVASPQIDVDGSVTVNATEKGNIVAVGLAAAVLTEPTNKPTSKQPDTDQSNNKSCGEGGGLGSLGGVNGFGASSLGNTKAAGMLDTAVPALTFAAGVSVAFNSHESDVKAFIDDPSIRASSISVDADSTVTFRAIVIGGAVNTRAGSNNAGVGGAIAVNNIENSSTQAYIRDADIETTGVGLIGPGVSIHALNNSTIYSDGGGVALVIASGATTSTNNLSLGISVALNAIDTDTLAFIDNSPIVASDDVIVRAERTPTIDALTIAGALAVSSGGTGNVLNLAGAGAGAKNAIRGKTHAYVIDTDPTTAAGIVTRHGADILVEASDKSKITSDGGAVAAALSFSATGSYTNLGFGVAVAINDITSNVQAFVKNSSIDSSGDITVTAISDATIDALTIGGALTSGGSFSGAGSGNTTRNTTSAYIEGGTGLLNAPAIHADDDIKVMARDTSRIIADAGGVGVVINIATVSGDDVLSGSFGIGAAINNIENKVLANILDSTVTGDSIAVLADSTANIQVLSIGGAGSVGIADGSATSFNGAGAGSGNTIKNTINASIDDRNDADGKTVVRSTGGLVSVVAVDNSTIKADAGAVAFAIGITQGSSNVNLSVGVSIAINDVKNNVEAAIKNAEVKSFTSIEVSAESTSTIKALTIAGAGSLGLQPLLGSGFGLQFAGAGAGSGNTIDGSTIAFIGEKSNIETGSASSVSVKAKDQSTIESLAVAGSISAQLGQGGSIAIAAAISKNVIDSDVLAYIDDSVVNSAGSVEVLSTSKSSMTATTVGVAMSLNIGVSSSVSIAGSGAGAQSTNTVTNTIDASIRNGSNIATQGVGDVLLQASDESTIKADSGGGSLAVSASPQAFSGAFGVSAGLSYNTVQNSILAYIDGTTTQVSSADQIVITANSKAKVDALAVSVAGTIAIVNPLAGFSLAMVGAGAESNNTIDNKITAYIGTTQGVKSAGNIDLNAIDDAKIRADVPAVSFAISLGVGLSTSVTLSSNTISNEVDAYIGRGQVVSTAGDISLNAQSNGKVESFATALSLNISIGGSGQGGKAVSQITGHTLAHLDIGARIEAGQGDVNIVAASTAYTNAENKGGGLGLLSITDLIAESTISAPTKAYVAGATISAGGLKVSSQAFGKDGVTARTAKSKVVPGTVAIVGGGGGKATSTVSGEVEAYIHGISTVAINQRIGTTGSIEILADSVSVADSDAPGGSGGGITVTALTSDATTSGATRAFVSGSFLSADNIRISSTADNLANAHLLVANVSVAGGGGGKATAKQLADTEAYGMLTTMATPIIGLPGTGVKILAQSTSNATAKAEGGGFGIINSTAFDSLSTIGEKVNDVVNSAATSAYLGSGMNIANFSSLEIDADSNNTATSNLTSVSIGGAGISSAHAKSNVYADTEAFLGIREDFGFPVSVTMPGGRIDIDSTSRTVVDTQEKAGGGGGLAIASAFTETNLAGTTASYVGLATNVTAGDLNVNAEILGATANADLLAATGGLVSIGSTKATVDSKPKAKAYLGKDVVVNAANVEVSAIGRGEADAKSNSSGGGVVQIGVANAKAIIDPKVEAYVAEGSSVTTTGNLSVVSKLLADVTPPPSDVIKDSPLDADTLAVDVFQDTVDFNIGVRTGDQLTYKKPTAAPSFGLTHDRTYNVIVVEPSQKLQFGEVFEAGQVNGLSDRIVFDSPHEFEPGDRVRYDAKGGLSIIEPWQTDIDPTEVFYVRANYADPSNLQSIDRLSIRLARTSQAALAPESTLLSSIEAVSQVDPSTDTISLPGHGFTEGQAVTYRASAVSAFLTEAVDSNVVNRSTKDAQGNSIVVKDVQRDANSVGLHFDNNNILMPGHLFNSGDAVTYSSDDPIGGLTPGRTYFVIRVDANQIKLAATYHQAIGLPFDDRGNSDPSDDIVGIPVTPIQLSPSSRPASIHYLSRDLRGLKDGQTYYVLRKSADTFQLAATADVNDKTPIAVDHSDDIEIVQRDGTIASTIRPLTRNGLHRIGTLGIDLRSSGGPQSLRIDLTGQPTLGDHRLLGATAATAVGDGISSADALGGSGGGLDINAPTANLTSTQTVTARIDASSITAGGNVSILASSISSVSSKANTGGGGTASIGEAHSDTVVNATTKATVAPSISIQAAGDFVMNSESDNSTTSEAKALGGGFFTVKVAETTTKLTGDTHSLIGEGAKVTAGGRLAVLSTSKQLGGSNSETYSVGIGAYSDSDNTNGDRGVTMQTPAKVEIGKGVTLEADSIDLSANIGKTVGTARASAKAINPILIGLATAFADANVDVVANASVLVDANPEGSAKQTKIIGRKGVDIQAHHPATSDSANYIIQRNPTALAVALIPPQKSRALGTATASSSIETKADALIVAGARNVLTPLVVRPTVPELALYVDADTTTTWNADVEILGGPSPELVVGTHGAISKQVNVTAVVDPVRETVVVSGISSNGPGQVLFEGDGTVKGKQGKMTFRRTLEQVKISSTMYTLEIGNITVANKDIAGREPKVTIDVPAVELEFDVAFDFKPTEIVIENLNPNPKDGVGVRLRGLIDNPIGTTTITTLGGGIYSEDFNQRKGAIRTNRLELNAATDVGGTSPGVNDRVPIDIVESAGLPAHMSVVAGRDIQIGIQGILRGPLTKDFVTTSETTPSLFSAGERADIMLLGGLQQNTVQAPVNFGIEVFETSRVKSPSPAPQPTNPPTAPRTTIVTNHFRVSTGTGISLPVGTFGTGGTSIDVTYDLGLIRAGRSIDVYKADAVTSKVNILSDTDLLAGNPINIDARTNGFVDLTEVSGDFRVGQIRSTQSDVTLKADGSILDVPDNLNTTGDTAADIIGTNLSLSAGLLIGFDAGRIQIDSSSFANGKVDANARIAIYLIEVNDGDAQDDDALNVGLIVANDVTLEALRGGIFDASNDFAADVIGNHIELFANRITAGTDGIGQPGNDLEIDSSRFSGGHLIAKSNGVLRITETENELWVADVSGIDAITRPDVYLTVRDTGSDRNDLIVKRQNVNGIFQPGRIEGRSVVIVVGDDFELPVDGSINATGAASIDIDPALNDPDGFGGTLAILTPISAATLQLRGGDDFDTFDTVLHNLPNGAEVKVFGGAPGYPVFPGDRLLVDTQGNLVSHPPFDQPSIEEGRGILTSAGFSSINYVSIELIDRRPNDPIIKINHDILLGTVTVPACIATPSFDFSEASGYPVRMIDYDTPDSVNARASITIRTPGPVGASPPPQGTLTLLDGTSTPANPLIILGTLGRLKQILASGFRYTPVPGFVGQLTIRILMVSEDTDGAAGVGEATLNIGCTTNNAPINLLPRTISTTQTTVLLSRSNNNALSVTDVDAGNATNFTVSLSVPTGVMTLQSTTGVSVTGAGSTASPFVITGSLANINATLAAGVRVSVPEGFTGLVPLTITSNDRGNTGSGGAKTDTDVLSIRVVDGNSENDAPINRLPATITTDAIPVILSEANGNKLSVTDIDAGQADNFKVTLSVPSGKLSLLDSAGVTAEGDGTTGQALTLTGTLANINSALAKGLRLQLPFDNFLGTYRITMISDDRGNSGSGGAKTDTDVLEIIVTNLRPANDPPVNQLPPSVTTSDVPYVFSAAKGNNLFVTDVDAGTTTNFLVSLSVTDGRLTLASRSLLTQVFGVGTAVDPLRLRGTLANINQTLAEGLVYLPGLVPGTVTLTIISNDGGATGTGGPQSDMDSLTITIFDPDAANQAPVNHVPGTITTDQLPIVFSQSNLNAISVSDIDAGNNEVVVTLTAANGRLYLDNPGSLANSGVGTVASPLTLTGNLASINSALLSGLRFVPPGGFVGLTSITINSNDMGNSGIGGPLQDTDVILINILDANSQINDPPVNHLPPNVVTSVVPILFSEATRNMISVTDVDAGNADNFKVELRVADGILALVNKDKVSVSGNGTPANPLILIGQLTNIDTVLAMGVRFYPPGGFLGTTLLTVTSSDRGNTGGPEQTDTDSFSITIIDPDPLSNDAPVNHLPPPVISDQLPTILSYANNNFLYVTDVDSGNTPNFTVSLSVPVGTLTLSDRNGLSVTGAGTVGDPLILTGLLDAINVSLLAGVQFLPPVGFLGSTKLTIHSNDRGLVGVAGSERTDTDELDITIVDNNTDNDPPVNHLPSSVVSNGVPFVLSAANGNAIYVTDIDVGDASNFSVSLELDTGKLKLPTQTNLSVTGNGTSTSRLTIVGKLADINAALASGLEVIPFGDYLKKKPVLTITSNDNGNTGTDGRSGIDIDSVEITILDSSPLVNDPPTNHGIVSITTSQTPVVFSEANGNELFVTDIDAGIADNFQVTLFVDNGTLSLANFAGLTISGTGTTTSPLLLVGSLDKINHALAAGLTFVPTSGTVGTSILTIISNDKGNTGNPGNIVERTDTDVLNITITDGDPNNNPPINHLPLPFSSDASQVILSLATGNGLSVTDVDAGNASDFTVTLGVANGNLTLLDTSGLTVTGDGSIFNPLRLIGTIADINARLANGLRFDTFGMLGVRTISMVSNDRANSGLGGEQIDSDTLDITIVSPFNDAPVNQLPVPFETNQSPIILSEANGNALSVRDDDAGDAADFQVEFSVDFGTLQLLSHAGLTVTGNGRSTNSLVITGRLADINAALKVGLRVLPPGGFRGVVTLTMVSNDNGNTGLGGPLTDADILAITIKDYDLRNNNAPINHLPPPVVTRLPLYAFSESNGNQLYVSDIDAGIASNFQVELKVAHGMLVLANPIGVTFTGDGSAANPLVIVGVLSKIDDVLAAGVVYLSNGHRGKTTLTITSNDNGNTGFGGALRDVDTLSITIIDDEPVKNDPPENHLPPPIVTSSYPVVLSQANGNAIYVTDVDAGTGSNFSVQLHVGNDGYLGLKNRSGLTVTGNGSILSPLLLTGTLETINKRLVEGLQYVPTGGFQGTAVLTILSDDGGQTGDDGAKTDTDTLLITISNSSDENDAPVNIVPTSVTFGQLPAVLAVNKFNALAVADVDAAFASNFTVSLSVMDGRLSLMDRRDLTVTGNGTPGAPLVLVGTLADINERLAFGLEFIPGRLGSTTLTIISNDQGNTGTGGAKSDTDRVALNIVDDNPDFNDPPVNYGPALVKTSNLPVVFSESNLNVLSVADIDAGNATNFEVKFSVPVGELSLLATDGVTISGNRSSAITLTGSMSNINAALVKGLSFLPPSPFVGQYILRMESNDRGNKGLGGPKTAVKLILIEVEDSDTTNNDPPVNHLPPPVISNQLPTVLSHANGNKLFVTDIDAGNATDFVVTLHVADGTLRILSNTGLTVSGVGTKTNPLVLVGALKDINAALATGLSFMPTLGFFGKTQLVITSNDKGNTGAGGARTDTDTLIIEIADLDPANDGPVNHLPPAITSTQTLVNIGASSGNAIFVTDIDAGNAANFTVTLSVANGVLSMASLAGLALKGNGTTAQPLVLTGTLADINAALASGLLYNSAGFVGTTTLAILSNDNGNSGPGIPLTDFDLLNITVSNANPANDAPVNHLPSAITTSATSITLSTANGNALFVTDEDAGGANNFTVTLVAANGQLLLANTAGITQVGDGTVANPMVLTGTLSSINAALGLGLVLNLPINFAGPTELTINSNDMGNSGLGGPLTDTDKLSIRVTNNIAPRVLSVVADSNSWTSGFRDFVDATFVDPSALGYQVPKGIRQYVTIPWVNVDRLNIVFNEDVGASLSVSDFKLEAAPGYLALGNPTGTLPTIIGLTYNPTSFTATLLLDKPFSAAVVDLKILASGVSDGDANRLDGEWLNTVSLASSGDNVAGGDFSFRLFILPGDTMDLTNLKSWNVNSTDGQRVRDLQNGIAIPGIGVFGYDVRADLDGNNRINSTDGTLVRDQQNAIIIRRDASGGVGAQQNAKNASDVNDDGMVSPLDVLLTISELYRRRQSPALEFDGKFYDVSGDGLTTPLDVLLVISDLNRSRSASLSGEGEASAEHQDRASYDFDSQGEQAGAWLPASEVDFGNSHSSEFPDLWSATDMDATLDLLATDTVIRRKRK